MRINTNVSANSALLNLGRVQDQVSKSMEKLSSGFRINHASDDAAGLGIANSLRANTRALTQASRNAEQASAELNVAEGGADSIQSILERMKELAAQSASSNAGDRTQLQAEYNTMRSEIDRIVNTTSYQGQKLIDGSMGNKLDTDNTHSTLLADTTYVQASSVAVSGGVVGTYTLSVEDSTHLTATDASGNAQTVAVSTTGAQTVNFSQFGFSFQTTAAFDAGTGGHDLSTDTVKILAGTSAADFLVSASGQYSNATNGDLVRIANAINLGSGSSGLNISSANIDTQANAESTLASLDTAINSVSTALGTIGATQNRVNFALDNTKSAIQNYTAAESTIRDVDMASEMTMFSKNQILAQAGTAMLAQANQLGAGVLKLLQ